MPPDHRYAGSQRLLERARHVIPGAHHLSGRALVDEARSPAYFDHATGCRIWDVDGRPYVDYLMAYGAVILGYADARVDGAAFDRARSGALLSLNHPLHPQFVEALLARFPFADMGIFLKTGSEATTAALRIARRATGRRKVIRCGYHGWHDWCLPLEPFVASSLAHEIVEVDANDPAELERALAADPGAFAAVIVAPEMVRPLEREPFVRIAAATREHGAVFVLDEIKTAFRVAPRSVHQRLAFAPDLLTVSKAMGNGWPVAAVLGTRAVMEHAAGLHLSATYHGDTMAIAASLTTLEILDREPVLDRLEQLGTRLLEGLTRLLTLHRLPGRAYGEPVAAMPFLRFEHPDADVNRAVVDDFYEHVLARGFLLHPRHLWFLSHSHSEADVDRTLAACDEALALVERRWPEARG
jgi:glutamate-1-semialdehyde 2,1-aminomutase